MAGNSSQTERKENYTETGHRANYSGPSQGKGTDTITMFGEQEGLEVRIERMPPHPLSGSGEVGYMRPCGKDGKELSAEEAKGFRMQFNGRNYPLEPKRGTRFL